jgi:UDP-N-acetyl-D-mannosaminuronic acid dehydrogenase
MAGSPAGERFDLDVVVIDGCGHVGLPLAIAFADRGARVGHWQVSHALRDYTLQELLITAEGDEQPPRVLIRPQRNAQ